MKSTQPICNKRLLTDVQLTTKESTATIKDAVDFYGKFIADTIKVGAFETIMIPYFGKFQPKTKEIQWKANRRGLPKPDNDKTHDEPVQHNGELRCGDQQGVDTPDSSLW